MSINTPPPTQTKTKTPAKGVSKHIRKPVDGDKLLKALIPLIIVPIVYLIAINLENNQANFERFYATGINKWFNELLSILTGVFDYSFGELIVYAHVIAAPIVAFILLIKVFKGGFFKSAFRLIQYASILYIAFMLLWGFNYDRQSISETMGFTVDKYTKEQLYHMTAFLIDEANDLRRYQLEDNSGVMTIKGDYKEIFARAHEGYSELGNTYKVFSGYYGKPKPILASNWMLYTGITGVYFPFTAEANVNVSVPDLLLPATTLHEMAHQRGIAPEDEANFVAYLTAMRHPDRDFNYSGTILALIHAMNALYTQDPDMAMELRETYSEDVNRDVVAYSHFWDAYEGKTNEVADKVNDTYLKTNRQEDGVKSYGLMVDLMLGYYYDYMEATW